jgi:hypothetical protein
MRARSGSLCTPTGRWRSLSWAAATMAAGMLLLGSAAWAQSDETSEPAAALRLIKIIPINGTAANRATKMFSFDISFVDQATGLYYLGDRSNAAVDVIDTTTDTLFGQIGANPAFQPGFAGDTGTANTSGPNGVAASGNCIFVTDTPSRVVSFDSSVSFTAAVSSFNTGGGNVRADELAFDPKDRLLLVINNANTPPFGTLINVSTSCVLSQPKTIFFTTANGVNATNGAEQPVWDPGTQRFYVSIPEVNGNGSNGPNGGVVRINTSGVIEKFYPINFCQPSGLTLGPNEDLLVQCTEVFTTSGNECSAVNAGAGTAANPGNAATLQSLNAIIPPVCNGIASPQVAICNVTPGRDCTGNALVSVPGVGGGDEVWFNSGDNNYYTTAGNFPAGPVLGVVASGATSTPNTLTQLIPSLYAQLQQGITNTSSFVHSAGTVHSIAASAANNHVYVPLPANNAYEINGVGCAQGCIAVFSAQ